MKRILSLDCLRKRGKKVKVAGWVNSIRSHGKLIFIDLRDDRGLIQIVFTSVTKDFQLVRKIRPEWVIEVIGKVERRPKEMINPYLKTGKIEIKGMSLKVLSRAKTLPIIIDDDGYKTKEELRLKYRYLDLRRERLKRNLKIRSRIANFIRNYLTGKGFLEIETPILTKSTPEGARDFVVPSRLYPGKFYALPQSPQQYKQLLMVSGIEKYFQIAKALRDEDPRADRQPEHTQIDLEIAFLEKEEEILNLVEKFFISLIKKFFPKKKITKIPFPRLTYQKVMKKYKSDRPDLRKDKKNPNELAFVFIVDFPMFVWHKEEKRWTAMHHPFTKPKTDDLNFIKKNPQKILAHQYDLVLNGFEIGGGSLRTTDPEILLAVFEVLGHKRGEILKKFGHLFKAFSFGVPPHGGIAIGFDRVLAILLEEPNIREVIAFPKTGDFRDPMMDIPSEIEKEQLKELNLKVIKKKK